MTEGNKIISVVLITYKEFSYVYETLDSILMQDYPAIEIVLTDDCSPHFPENNIREYVEKKKNSNIVGFKILRSNTNNGTVKNINFGIKNANGDYIRIIAGDDVFYNEYVFSDQMHVFDLNPNLMIVTGRTCECDQNLNVIFKAQVENTNKALPSLFSLEPKQYFSRCNKEGLFPLVTQALLFKREYFDKYGLYDEQYRLLEDPPMEKRIIINRVPVGVADCTVVKHRAYVGISSNEHLFSTRQSQYFLDLTNYVKNELLTRPQFFKHFRTKQRYKKEKYRYEMSIAKGSKQKFFLTIKNIDTAFWFVFYNPQRALEKIRLLTRKKNSIGVSGK